MKKFGINFAQKGLSRYHERFTMIENAEDFRKIVIKEIFLRLVKEPIKDNWIFRGPYFGKETEVRVDFHVSQLEYFCDNYKDLFATFLSLSDINSKVLFMDLILYRLLGHSKVKIKNAENCVKQNQCNEKSTKLLNSRPSNIDLINYDGKPLMHFEGYEIDGKQIALELFNSRSFKSAFNRMQYFLSSDNSFNVQAGDTVIDGGTCLGESSIAFSIAAGKGGKVFAFDPISNHCKVARQNAMQNGLYNITVIQQGLGENTNNLDIKPVETDRARPDFNLDAFKDQISITSIDDFVEKENIEQIDFIKMDIEGWELQALKGAAKTIEKHYPKLAICLYHRFSDFVSIPQWIISRYPEYEFRIGHYTIFEDETVLYAKKRDT